MTAVMLYQSPIGTVLIDSGVPGPRGPMGATGATGPTGPASWGPSAPWVTATAYTATSPRSVVTNGGNSYECLVSHTSGTFATDLAAGKWSLIAAKGADGAVTSVDASGGTTGFAFTGGPITSGAGTLTLTIGDAPTIRSALGLVIGTNVAAVTSPAFAGAPTAPTQSANDNSTKLATTAYTDAAVGAVIAAADAMVFKGVIDCSANPNYPAADRGWAYKVSVAGKIGGASGPNVEVGDTLLCLTDGTASGNHATVGAQWNITQANLDGVVIGPASAVDGRLALFDGTSGRLIKDGGVAPSANAITLLGHTFAQMRSDLGLGTVSVMDEATAAQFWANTADKAITTDAAWASAVPVALTDAATITVAMGTFINAYVTLGGNRTLGAPSNAKPGQSGCIEIIQPASGGPRTLAYHADWYFAGGTDPTLSTAANARDLLFYQVMQNGKTFASLVKAAA